MFLHTLTENEKPAFLALAREFVRADGVIRPEEKQALARYTLELSLPADAKLPQRSRQEHLAVFASRRSRVAALLEMLALANADRDFAEQEREFISGMSQALGFSQDELRAMCSWIDRYEALMAEAEQLVSPAPPPLPASRPARRAAKKTPKQRRKPARKPAAKKRRK